MILPTRFPPIVALTPFASALTSVYPLATGITGVLDLVGVAGDDSGGGGVGDRVDVAVSEVATLGFLAAEVFDRH
jgi:hypothetical protein